MWFKVDQSWCNGVSLYTFTSECKAGIKVSIKKYVKLAWSWLNSKFTPALLELTTQYTVQEGVNRGRQIRQSVLFFVQIRQSATIFVQIRIRTIWKLWVVYSRLPITRTFKGNWKTFDLPGVENKWPEIRKKRCLRFFHLCNVYFNQIWLQNREVG